MGRCAVRGVFEESLKMLERWEGRLDF
jgi:hypothetical protein